MLVFATIFGVGFFILILSMIFGHDSDIDIDPGDIDVGASGPSIFSAKMIALLMVGFGAVGFGIRATTDYSMFYSSMGGVCGAGIMGIIGYLIIRAFYSSQESSTINDADVIGHIANVIDTIGEGTNGQIVSIIRGREISFLAKAEDGTMILKGSQVTIVSKIGNVVIVKK